MLTILQLIFIVNLKKNLDILYITFAKICVQNIYFIVFYLSTGTSCPFINDTQLNRKGNDTTMNSLLYNEYFYKHLSVKTLYDTKQARDNKAGKKGHKQTFLIHSPYYTIWSKN